MLEKLFYTIGFGIELSLLNIVFRLKQTVSVSLCFVKINKNKNTMANEASKYYERCLLP
jgi:hypothetical protein